MSRALAGIPTAQLAATLAHCEQRAPDPDPLERALDEAQRERYRDEIARRVAEQAVEVAA